MLALGVIEPVHWPVWAAFIASVLIFLALDLGVFNRHGHVVKFNEALGWTAIWMVLAGLFAVGLNYWRGRQEAVEFCTGYVIELSLSMDNVFVIAMIFAYFRVPAEHQHRVLFWGILGLRSLYFVLAGAIAHFSYLKYGLSVVLIFIGGKMLAQKWVDLPTPLALAIVVSIIAFSILFSMFKKWKR